MPTALILSNKDEVWSMLAEQLAGAPLYTQVGYEDTSDTRLLPHTICLFCEPCDQQTNWETYINSGGSYREGFGDKEYTCRNCKKNKIKYHFYWGSSTNGKLLFFKLGQWPALEERIPRELQKNLDRSSLSLYYKALRSRNQN